MAHPLRVQRKRTKGYRLPSGSIYVGRPTKWGNPFETAEKFKEILELIIFGERDVRVPCNSEEFFKMLTIARSISELRGLKLACWCSLDKPCHADVLAEIANS